MEDFFFNDINTSLKSYEQFGKFYEQFKNSFFESINIHLNNWFGANMSAVLGGLLDKISEKNFISIKSNNQSIITILQKNTFLANYGYSQLQDLNSTTIKYLKLKSNESRFFNSYINTELLSKEDLPEMTDALKKKISESIYEIFVNAQTHSKSEYIYTCGQFFPAKNKIEFTIVDMGQGFKKTINERFNQNLSSIQAIKWALMDHHTTKTDAPGGIGLAILKEFIKLNKGKFQIISYDGFYESVEDEKFFQLQNPFPGTIINMEFITNDPFSYKLSSVVDIDNIF